MINIRNHQAPGLLVVAGLLHHPVALRQNSPAIANLRQLVSHRQFVQPFVALDLRNGIKQCD